MNDDDDDDDDTVGQEEEDERGMKKVPLRQSFSLDYIDRSLSSFVPIVWVSLLCQ